MLHYRVPTSSGEQTRKSAAHSLAGERYHYLALHVWAVALLPATSYRAARQVQPGALVEVTWHSRRDLAEKARPNISSYAFTRRITIPILPEHCREPAKRGGRA